MRLKKNFNVNFGVSVIEMMLVVAVIALVMAFLAPYFYTLRTAFNTASRKTELLQNGRIAMQKMITEIRQARKIVSVTSVSNTDGEIIFIDNDNNTIGFKKYNDGTREMLGYLKNGAVFPLAGPITSLKFDAKTKDGVTSTTTPALVKSVDIELVLHDEDNVIPDEIFTGTVFLRKYFFSSLYCGIYSNTRIDMYGYGTTTSDGVYVHSNGAINRTSWRGTPANKWYYTTSADGIYIPPLNINFNSFTAVYDNYINHNPPYTFSNPPPGFIAINGNHTFTGSTSGNYFITGDAFFDANDMTLNGTCVALGKVEVRANRVKVNPANNMPAIVAGGLFQTNQNNQDFVANGPIYANAIDLRANSNVYTACVNCTLNNDKLALVAKSGDITFNATNGVTILGSVIAAGSSSQVNISAKNSSVVNLGIYPLILSAGSITIGTSGFTGNGLIYSNGNTTINSDNAVISGFIGATGVLTLRFTNINKPLTFNYSPNSLFNPPPFLVEE